MLTNGRILKGVMLIMRRLTPSHKHREPAIRLALFVVTIVLLDGCIAPHTTPRLLPFEGIVLDERTHAPIVNAKVFLTAHPEVACKSDSFGHFKFKEIVNWHYGYTLPAFEELPPGEQWGYDVTIAHTNYISRQAGFYHGNDNTVLLKTMGELSEPHPWLIFNDSGEILKDMGASKYLKPGDINFARSAIHIGFVHRVYDPQVTFVNKTEGVSIAFPELKGLDWEFRVIKSGSAPIKGSFREYRLEFTP